MLSGLRCGYHHLFCAWFFMMLVAQLSALMMWCALHWQCFVAFLYSVELFNGIKYSIIYISTFQEQGDMDSQSRSPCVAMRSVPSEVQVDGGWVRTFAVILGRRTAFSAYFLKNCASQLLWNKGPCRDDDDDCRVKGSWNFVSTSSTRNVSDP